MSDLTYHCADCKERNELADKLGGEIGSNHFLRQHQSTHMIGPQFDQLRLWGDDEDR